MAVTPASNLIPLGKIRSISNETPLETMSPVFQTLQLI
tara:strand:- start:96 stop:209 length:114 start_codon:yes stop_codon:yes gene_type:complete